VRVPLPYVRALHDTQGGKDHAAPSDLETSSASILVIHSSDKTADENPSRSPVPPLFHSRTEQRALGWRGSTRVHHTPAAPQVSSSSSVLRPPPWYYSSLPSSLISTLARPSPAAFPNPRSTGPPPSHLLFQKAGVVVKTTMGCYSVGDQGREKEGCLMCGWI
jgi:hypothetical protein